MTIKARTHPPAMAVVSLCVFSRWHQIEIKWSLSQFTAKENVKPGITGWGEAWSVYTISYSAGTRRGKVNKPVLPLSSESSLRLSKSGLFVPLCLIDKSIQTTRLSIQWWPSGAAFLFVCPVYKDQIVINFLKFHLSWMCTLMIPAL